MSSKLDRWNLSLLLCTSPNCSGQHSSFELSWFFCDRRKSASTFGEKGMALVLGALLIALCQTDHSDQSAVINKWDPTSSLHPLLNEQDQKWAFQFHILFQFTTEAYFTIPSCIGPSWVIPVGKSVNAIISKRNVCTHKYTYVLIPKNVMASSWVEVFKSGVECLLNNIS